MRSRGTETITRPFAASREPQIEPCSGLDPELCDKGLCGLPQRSGSGPEHRMLQISGSRPHPRSERQPAVEQRLGEPLVDGFGGFLHAFIPVLRHARDNQSASRIQ